MLKKIGLGVVVLLLTAISFVWVKYVIPFQATADKYGPESAARDYALQDEDAYRFARGEPLNSPGGEVMQLSRPLDFVAITDHAAGTTPYI